MICRWRQTGEVISFISLPERWRKPDAATLSTAVAATRLVHNIVVVGVDIVVVVDVVEATGTSCSPKPALTDCSWRQLAKRLAAAGNSAPGGRVPLRAAAAAAAAAVTGERSWLQLIALVAKAVQQVGRLGRRQKCVCAFIPALRGCYTAPDFCGWRDQRMAKTLVSGAVFLLLHLKSWFLYCM